MKKPNLTNYLVLAALICLALYQYSTTGSFALQQEGASYTAPAADENAPSQTKSNNTGFPDYVIKTLMYIKINDKAPEGYVGGRTFFNREKRLPKTDASGKKIKYREWDVHRKVKGKNRGAERLVTGSDGSAYYTKDHYRTFKKVMHYE